MDNTSFSKTTLQPRGLFLYGHSKPQVPVFLSLVMQQFAPFITFPRSVIPRHLPSAYRAEFIFNQDIHKPGFFCYFLFKAFYIGGWCKNRTHNLLPSYIQWFSAKSTIIHRYSLPCLISSTVTSAPLAETMNFPSSSRQCSRFSFSM